MRPSLPPIELRRWTVAERPARPPRYPSSSVISVSVAENARGTRFISTIVEHEDGKRFFLNLAIREVEPLIAALTAAGRYIENLERGAA